ncbi:phosphate ABC transporter permease PstA [Ilumatobacter sp.]|uniref:phosphate ABC transporter permease PstA n=1 Tax=Ilumatobacter sp. TaxID=1967498 RepID=UPI003AF61E58
MMSKTTPITSAPSADRTGSVRVDLTSSKRDVAGVVMLVMLLVCMLLTLGILTALLAQVFGEATPLLAERGTGFVTSPIGSDPDKLGVWSGLYGSVVIGLTVAIVAIPLGVAAAIYLEEYASTNSRVTRTIMVNIRNLAGVPAVIYGVLGFIIFTQWLAPLTGGKSAIAAGLTMSVLVLPIVVITAMESIRAVPRGIRDAGYGVGASRWEVTRDHVVPYAAPGILTGIVLSIARALGEAAPLIIIGAVTGLLPETTLTGFFTALPILIYQWTGRSQPPGSEFSFTESAAAAGVVLLVIVFTFNVVAILLRQRFERRRAGA